MSEAAVSLPLKLSALIASALCGRSRSHVSRSASALQAAPVGFFEISAGIDGPRVGLLLLSERDACFGRRTRPRTKTEKKADEEEIPPPEDIDLTDRRRPADEGHLLPRHQGPGEHSRDSSARVQQQEGNTAGRTSRRSRGWPRSCRRNSVAPSSCPTSAATARAPRSRWASKSKAQRAKNCGRPSFAMVTQDLRAVKDFLWKKNNEKKP